MIIFDENRKNLEIPAGLGTSTASSDHVRYADNAGNALNLGYQPASYYQKAFTGVREEPDILTISDTTFFTDGVHIARGVEVMGDLDNYGGTVYTNKIRISGGITEITGDNIIFHNGEAKIKTDENVTETSVSYDMTISADSLTFNGKDVAVKDDIEDFVGVKAGLTTHAKNDMVAAVNEVNTIAKGAAKATSFYNYSHLCTMLQNGQYDDLRVGQNIYINQIDVPDLWIMIVGSEETTYTYTNDADFLEYIKTDGRIGKYTLAFLETEKVNVSTSVVEGAGGSVNCENSGVATFAQGDIVMTSTDKIILSSGELTWNNLQVAVKEDLADRVQSNSVMKIVTLTQAEYDALENKSETTLYLVK